MPISILRGLAAGLGLLGVVAMAGAQSAPPREWVDPDTGHRIVRLSDEPGSLSLYFNFNGYTAQGDKLVISTPSGIATVDLKTHRLTTIVKGKVHLLFTGRKTRQVYYSVGADRSAGAKTIYAADIDSGKAHEVARLAYGTIQTINADETLIAGVAELDPSGTVSRDGLMRTQGKEQTKGAMMKARLEADIPMEIFTVNLKTGERRKITGSSDWLNHLLFSPTDPNLLMFCHEGDWHRVDRLWLIRTDKPDAQPTKIHTRTMVMEIAGHEWFSHDGKTIWYDLQTPRGEDFWVAGYEIATGKRTWYHLQRNEWSVHFNSSPDGSVFSGDGGDAGMVAHAPDGKWLYLFQPHAVPEPNAGDHAAPAGALIHNGYFTSEKLVNMKNHDYKLEPNANFTPDGKWLVFRSNMFGPSQVFAVELAKAAK
jgi:oligogalacturonide lyase